MSSMRNVIQRRSHRERAQPLERKKLGLLEKHKDYQKRAKDWGKKKETLKNLRQKAADRNEDEFSFKMLSRGKGVGSALTRGSDDKRARNWNGTVLGDRGGRAMDIEAVRKLKTQDLGFLRTTRNVVAKDVRQLEQRVIMAQASLEADGLDMEDDDEDDDDGDDHGDAVKGSRTGTAGSGGRRAGPQKIIFADTPEERDEAMAKAGEKVSLRSLHSLEAQTLDPRAAERKAVVAQKLQKRLKTARQRLAALTMAEQNLELQQARMAKTATVDMVTRAGKRIKVRERKR